MNHKKEFKVFTIFEHKREEEYLRRQHNAGWRFVKVSGPCIYHFEKCQPEDVVYQLDFRGGQANTGEYIKLFSDCGWEYIQDYVGYSYFCKPVSSMNGEEEIFCDDSSRNAMMSRVYKARLIPLLIIFFACLLPQFITNMMDGNYWLAGIFGAILVIYIALFTYCSVRYYQQKHIHE